MQRTLTLLSRSDHAELAAYYDGLQAPFFIEEQSPIMTTSDLWQRPQYGRPTTGPHAGHEIVSLSAYVADINNGRIVSTVSAVVCTCGRQAGLTDTDGGTHYYMGDVGLITYILDQRSLAQDDLNERTAMLWDEWANR